MEGALRVEGPGGPFHVIGLGDALEVHAESLRQVRRMRDVRGTEGVGEAVDRFDLPVRIVVREQTIAARSPGDASDLTVRWGAVALAGIRGLWSRR